MLIREMTEKLELQNFSKFATLCVNTKGRVDEETKCEMRTDYQRDRDRILHSKAFRRLKHKTQVFISPEGDHYRTRLTHTLEVSQIARTMARALRLNEDLAEAIALGHDLGHTPFGHAGEEILDSIHPGGFKHNVQSLRVVEKLENGTGLNLTYEVRDGILKHTGKELAITLEGRIVKMSDRIAYINHDIDDAIRGKVINSSDIPKECLEVLGFDHKNRINNMIKDIIKNSEAQNEIIMSLEVQYATDKLRDFMFDRVYIGSKAKNEEKKAQNIIKELYIYFNNNPWKLPEDAKNRLDLEATNKVVCDYVAGMTDRYAIKKFRDLFLPSAWQLD